MAFILWTLNVFLYVVMMQWSHVEGRSSPYHLETNEITNSADERAINTPVCGENVICGYVQANAKGINQQRLCACPSPNTQCPMAWDAEDGHSITQGSDQYKFCGKVGTPAQCESGLTAYKSRTVFSKITEEKLNQLDNVQCLCPKTHTYELSTQHFGDLDDETEIMDVNYICVPLPLCGTGDICKLVSETPDTYLVNRKCQCPAGLRCPTLSASHGESLAMGAGFIHPIRCQH